MRTKSCAILLLCVVTAITLPAQKAVRDTNISVRVLNFNWTPGGEKILFTFLHADKRVRGSSKTSVYSLDLKTGSVTPVIGSESNNPSMSPDGKMIAYTKYVENGSSDIYLFDTKTKQSFPLAADTTREMHPWWSPDGRQVTYCAERKGSGIDIYVIDVQSKQVRQITQSGSHRSYSPVWSPDGKKIVYYYETGDNRDQVYLTDPGGSFHQNLTHDTSTHNFYPSWAGKNTILYTRNSTGIATMNPDGSGIYEIPGIKTYLARHHPRKKQVAYIGIMGESGLMLIDLETGKKKVLIDDDTLYALL